MVSGANTAVVVRVVSSTDLDSGPAWGRHRPGSGDRMDPGCGAGPRACRRGGGACRPYDFGGGDRDAAPQHPAPGPPRTAEL